MESLALPSPAPRVRLRALTGRDERAADEGPGAGRVLVGRLLPDGGDADALTAAERDRLLADLWRDAFGDAIAASHLCAGCGEPFDLSFSLAELERTLAGVPAPAEVCERTAENHAVLRSGHVVRPLRGEDEAAVSGLDLEEAAHALARRCVSEGDGTLPAEDLLDRVLEWLDPILDTELQAGCPECGEVQSIRFSIEHYLIATLRRERPRLLREVHLLAASYGWPLGDILALDREERRLLAEHVERDRSSVSGSGWQ